MTSTALEGWRSERADRIGELLEAHTSVGGRGKGRRYRTEQLTWSITLRIAAEFQGFARDLHGLASDHIVAELARTNVAASAAVSRLLANGRRLDTGNPNAGHLGADFGRLGMRFWPVLHARYPRWSATAQRELDALLRARNGIAHADERALADIEADGYVLKHLATTRSWHGWMNRLAGMMDVTVGEYVGSMVGGPSPW